MSKEFRKRAPDQTWLLLPSPRDWLNEDHLDYFLLDVVGEMDLAPFFEPYKNCPSLAVLPSQTQTVRELSGHTDSSGGNESSGIHSFATKSDVANQ